MAFEWLEKGLNTAGDFTPVGLGLRAMTGKGLATNVKNLPQTFKKGVSVAAGQTDYRAEAPLLPQVTDADNPALARYNAAVAARAAQVQKMRAAYAAAGVLPEVAEAAIAALPPVPGATPEELRAGQIEGDRARLLGVGQDYKGLVSNLQLAAGGKGPSAALDTLKDATGRNISTAYGMASSGNVMPGQRAALLGAAMQQSGQQNQQAARDAAIIKANETAQARGQLGQALGGEAQNYTNLYTGTMKGEEMNQDAQLKAQEINQKIETANAQQAGETTRSVLNNIAGAMKGGGGGGGGNASSDIRSKTAIAPGSSEVADTFRAMGDYGYEYKDPRAPGAAPGRHYGPMAHELEATPAGASAVVPMKDGKKGIDTGRLALLNAAATADMRRELDAMKGGGRTASALQRATVDYPRLASNGYGAVEAGNIDLSSRPHVRNPDGSVSTVRSMGVNLDGREVLIPTVSDRGYVMSPDEAIDEYRRTGRHLGVYRSVRDSNAAAQAIHEDQERNMPRDTLGGMGGYRSRAVADAADRAMADMALDDFRRSHFTESEMPSRDIPTQLDAFRASNFTEANRSPERTQRDIALARREDEDARRRALMLAAGGR